MTKCGKDAEWTFDVYLHKVTWIKKGYISWLIELNWSPWITRLIYHHSRTQCSRLHTEWGFSETTSRIWECRGWNCLPAVLTSTPLTLVGSAWMCFSCQSDQHNHIGWLDKCWLKNWMPSHSSVWPAWGGGARLTLETLYDSSKCYWGSCLLNW